MQCLEHRITFRFSSKGTPPPLFNTKQLKKAEKIHKMARAKLHIKLNMQNDTFQIAYLTIMQNDTCQNACFSIYAKMAQNMQIGICVKLHNYLIPAIEVQYHNFCTVCALRMQFVCMEVD